MITATDLPDRALLTRYAERDDCFTDCYMCDLGRPVEFGTFVCAFYDSWAFAPEKAVLRLVLGRPAREFDPLPMALGTADHFAAWTVEARAPGEVLLCDRSGRTRSWLSVKDTCVYFGSAVVPPKPGGDLGALFRALLGFHHRYSRILLAGAVRKLKG